VTGRRLAGAGATVVLLVLAALLGLLALDVLRWGTHMSENDVALAAAPTVQGLEPETRLPAGISRRLLGVGDDLEFRQALQLFRLSRPGLPPRDLHDVALRSRAETALARVARDDPSRTNRSRASVLMGVLALLEARESEAQRSVFLRRSLTELREAARLDPGNEDAKYDLELVLRLTESSQDESGGGSGGRGDTPAAGAGAASSGSGY
jgi:hypothetical protein